MATNIRRSPGPEAPTEVAAPPARERFLETDAYRAGREWGRYEGTAQRDLFRLLRFRFLRRHRGPGAWAVDLGAGPLRFTRAVGPPGARRIALDLSRAMLSFPGRDPDPGTGPVERVVGDAARPPFAPASFGTAALFGNPIGFAADAADRVLAAARSLVTPGGLLLVEVAPGPGERSRYLSRLPAGARVRLFRAPTRAVVARIAREGFSTEPTRKAAPGEFRRLDPAALAGSLAADGWTVEETVAVAPALGPDVETLQAIARDRKAWDHLLEVEETLGREPARWR